LVAIYAHSRYGQKIEMMRQDSEVSFEVDHVEGLGNWNSAVCWGTHEELEGAEAERALRMLREHLAESLRRSLEHGELVGEATVGGGELVV
jgi:nitroimidazol reductase NimA-like FMN-containing flavoprotein (pyridoxamine 5'-phosphate oxidase superfamily)